MQLALGALPALAARGLDLILPPRCAACGAFVSRQGDLCAACWGGLAFLEGALCNACGRPLPDGAVPTCGPCLAAPPPWDRARAALRYDERSARLILGFKNAGRLQALPAFGRWMARAGEELLADADSVVAVPLHRLRLWRRGYNQALLLARAVANASGRPLELELLRRPRSTGTQRGRGAAERRDAVTRSAFAVPDRSRARIAGRNLVLVDDVYTTGSTLSACTHVLREAGAARIDVLVLARVVLAETNRISLA